MSALLSCALVSCSKREASEDGMPIRLQSDIVARVGSETISKAEFEAFWSRRAAPAMDAGELMQQRERLLGNLIQTKAALARARSSGFDESPKIVALIDELIAARYMEETFAARLSAKYEVTEAEIINYYNDHPSVFEIPAAVRAGVIEFKVSSKASEEKRAEQRLVAERIRQQAVDADDSIFSQLVQQHSENQSTRYIGGDTGWLTAMDITGRWEPEVIQAVFALHDSGEVAPLIECSNAFYVVRLKERSPTGVHPLEQVFDSIRYQLQQAKVSERQQAVLQELTNGLSIEVNRAVLDEMSVSAPKENSNPPSIPGS